MISESVSVEANKTLARRVLEASILNDVAFLEEVVAPEYVQHGPGVPPTREAFFAFARWFRHAFPDGRFVVDDVVGEGDKVLLRWTFKGTQIGTWMGRPPTGKYVEFVGMDLWRFVDGKFVESWFIMDTMGMLRQLGHLPAQLGPAAGGKRAQPTTN
jgi:predicted ester cyclase